MLLAATASLMACSSVTHAGGPYEVVPAVKQWDEKPGSVDLSTCWIGEPHADLAGEAEILTEFLQDRSIRIEPSGASIKLELRNLDLPTIRSAYAESIRDQAYLIRIDAEGVTIQGRTPAGVFYGVQTFTQIVTERHTAPHVDIVDWPDLAFRGVMVDSARANENADYYERLIQFAGRYKLNRIHLHLTDDQSVALHHDRYAPILHPFAWKPESLSRLVQMAARFHIQIMPEIESLGHARIFLKHPEFREFLHQTEANKPPGSWVGTIEPGYTNVLCPASERATSYLRDMYELAANVFPYPIIHLGCDEVDMTECSRCIAAFGCISHADWFRRHLQNCRSLAPRHMRVGVWGDMLLRYPEILDELSPDDFLIYDWHYNADVSEQSVLVFRERGFQVFACPALVCHPRMILPVADNYANIGRFAEIARKHDLRGLDTTIWIPTRYLSDALWTGIAYAAAHSWSGSAWNEPEFYRSFLRSFFGSSRGDDFAEASQSFGAIDWNLDRFRLACWIDDESLSDAKRQVTGDLESEARRSLNDLQSAATILTSVRPTITDNRAAWDALEHSVAILAYTIEHFLAAADLGGQVQGDANLLRKLDASCAEAIGWIEADWDRNRFADDPGKADIHQTGQHLMHRFRQMHLYHLQRLKDIVASRPAEPPAP
jgi:hypothetical protein